MGLPDREQPFVKHRVEEFPGPVVAPADLARAVPAVVGVEDRRGRPVFRLNRVGLGHALVLERPRDASLRVEDVGMLADQLRGVLWTHLGVDVVVRVAKMVDEIGETMASGTPPQKKHLLQRVVKKVLVHDRRTVEVWYGLPDSPSVRAPEYLAPRPGLEPGTY